MLVHIAWTGEVFHVRSHPVAVQAAGADDLRNDAALRLDARDAGGELASRVAGDVRRHPGAY